MKVNQVTKGTIKPIKPFKNLDEEARFWETRDVIGSINDKTVLGFHRTAKADTLTIRFSHEDIQKLREEAEKKGRIEQIFLIRQCILL